MSRQRSQSPRYRRFPWDDPDFDPHKVIAELDGMPRGRSPGSGEETEEHWGYRGDMALDGRRRSPHFRGDRHFPHERHPEEFYSRRLSPFHDVIDYGDRRLSPQHNGGVKGDRHRERFREHFEDFEDRRRSQSPVRLQRERVPLSPRSQSDQLHRHPGIGWRREDQSRSRGEFNDHSPGGRSNDQRGGVGRERGQRNVQSPHGNRRRETPRREERNPSFKRHRREMDDDGHLGYGKEEEFVEQRYSPRDGFAGDAQGEILRSGCVVEHDRGIDNRDAPRREHLSSRRDHELNSNRQRNPYQVDYRTQEHFKKPNSRTDEWESMSGGHFQDNWKDPNCHEANRSPLPQDRPNPMRYTKQNSPMNHGGKRGVFPAKGRFSRGRNGPPRGLPRFHQSSQEYQNPPPKQQRPAYQPLREDHFKPSEEEPNWDERGRFQPRGDDRPGSADRQLPREYSDPKVARSRERGWSNPKANSMTVVSEETLTIKVDMSRPVNQNSQLCYSSDRQLSLDLVNVGRQRLDFLPMLEHSGTYRESATHTGTFAQEIITLVHQVKDQYFRGDDITLNERFSTPQKGSYSEEETEELTLDQRFSSSRGFSLNVNSVFDAHEPLFSRLGPMQGLGMHAARDPGDLRHDLERRRQERLEGVKVTIPGTSLPHRPLGSVSEQTEYGDKDEMSLMGDGEFSNWSTQQNRRHEGNMGPRRGAPYRKNIGPQRKNNRLGNRLGPYRKENDDNNPIGPSW